MATSSGKTLGFVLLLVVILLLGLRAIPFMFVPLGVFPRVWHALNVRVLENSCFHPFGWIGTSLSALLALALFILWVGVIVWVYRDAERRGMNGVLWALLVFIGNLIGLIIYLIVRSENPLSNQAKASPSVCPKCATSVGRSHVFCPHCGEHLQAACPKCGKPIEKEWHVCPYCGEKLT